MGNRHNFSVGRAGFILGALLLAWMGIRLWRSEEATAPQPPVIGSRSAEVRPSPRIAAAAAVLKTVELCDPSTAAAAIPAAPDFNRAAVLARVATFDEWLTDFRRTDDAAKASLSAIGGQLAAVRRAALKELIAADPEEALRRAVPRDLRADLPADVLAQLETPVEGNGDFDLSVACYGPMNTARVERHVTLDDQTYEAYTYGRRADLPSKAGLPVHGIVLDNRMAVSASATRPLEPGEKVALGFPADAVVLASGAVIRAFAGGDGAADWENQLDAAETAAGPQIAALSATGKTPVSTGTATTLTPTGWTVGAKRLLFIRVDTSDIPGDPISLTLAQSNMTEVAQYYSDVSETLTSVATTFVPVTLRLPKTAATYAAANDYLTLRSDALAAARAYDTAHGGTGTYNPDKYDLDITFHPRIVFPSDYAGIGLVGSRGVWINGGTAAGVPKHELGHNYGLQHANGWQPTGTSPIGAGTHVEYGDMFDVMGVPSNAGHFNAWFKNYLSWIPSTGVQKVTTSGTYRLYQHDAAKASGVRALMLGQVSDRAYWIDVRRQFTTNASQMNGVNVRWAMIPSGSTVMSLTGSRLLDMTPGTTGGFSDAALQIGQKFVDSTLGITITPTAKGGTPPNAYVDVQIAFGATGTNHNPILSLAASTSAPSARTAVKFTATASDPDGNPIAYAWAFDGVADPSTTSSVSHTWAKAGTYAATCTVTDGLGGIATQTLTVTVTDLLANWLVTKGTNADYYYGFATTATQAVAVGLSGMTSTSADGLTWKSTRVASGTPALYGAANGAGVFVAVGARNSVVPYNAAVERSTDGINWVMHDPGFAERLMGVAFGASRFVAVGDAGRIISSVDGVTWTADTSGVTKALRAVTFGNGKFVATGDAGTVLISTDGLVWTNRTVTTATSLGAVAYGGGVYVASGQFETWTSADATTWAQSLQVSVFSSSTTGGPGSLAWTGSVFVSAGAAGTVYFSTDGKAWSSYALSTAPTVTLQAITGFNGNALAAGWDGSAGYFLRSGGTVQTAK